MDEHVTYRQQVHFCGKPRCRKCRDGIGHGPYWYAYHLTPEGRTVRTYIGRQLPAEAAQSANSTSVLPTSTTSSTSLPSHIYKTDALPTPRGEIDEPERLLASDPTNEAALQALMIALAKAKRRGEAMRVYQRFVASSRTAISPHTQNIYNAIQRGDDPANLDRRDGESEPRVGRGNQSPLVGRDAEREALRLLLLAAEQEQGSARKRAVMGTQSEAASAPALAVASTRPRCMVLMGESGIGKTRLVEETARDALRGGWSVVWSHAYAQESGIPYRMWSETLRSIIEQGLWDPSQTGQSQLYNPLLALLPELRDEWQVAGERVESGPYHHNPRSPEQEQVQLRESVYELLAAVSARAPLLLALDDVQWADGSSCEMLGYLARRLHGLPIALLATCRENELASNNVLRQLLSHMQREHAVEYLHIKPLSDAEIAALVAHLPGALVRRIQSQAAGNPFFAEELAHSLHSQSGAHIDNNQQGVAEPAESRQKKDRQAKETTTLPTSITGALNSRLQRLSDPCRHLLDKASVLGGSFGLPMIVAMEVSHADEDTVLDLLDEALNAGVLTEEGAGTRVTYRFWHPLLASHL
ncbi:MAG TPA: AAA family ATPase, partial [Ktedonobacteraceae bacterium]|nr:AAA family ATPase [Ktedonobacteraceae bacterium]